jgi:calcium-dependent protein kinase
LKGPVGNLHYSAPEILKGQGNYDEKCDIWSIGIITYLLFSLGEFPFDGTSE